MKVSTLEFKHPALPNGVLRYVKDPEDLHATLETGEKVWFTAGQFDFQLPDRASGGQEALKVAAPNTDITLANAIEAAKRYQPAVAVESIYREYDLDDLSAPCNKPIKLTLSSAKITTVAVSLTNSWKDLTNRRFMRRIYTSKTHPGLSYL